MKKTVGIIALLIVSIMTMAGCGNMHTVVDIHSKNSASAVIEGTIDRKHLAGQSLDDALAGSGSFRNLTARMGDDWTMSKIDTGEQVGLRFETARKMSLSELQHAFLVFDGVFFIGMDGKNYVFAMPGHPPATGEDSLNSGIVTVNFPGEVVYASPNAQVHGHSVDFDLVAGGSEYTAIGAPDNTMFYSLIFGGALLLITFIVVLAFAPKAAKDEH